MKPELRVERHVLGQVPDRVVRLGAEHRADLVDPFEHTDHRLLVELRRLRQVRRSAEVVQREHVRAGLGRRTDDLRRLDLGETLTCRASRGNRATRLPRPPSRPAPRGAGARPARCPGSPAARRRLMGATARSAASGPARSAARSPGRRVSAPPGACGFAATVPVTWTTVSSPSSSSWAWVSGALTTIWLRPDRSRRTRKLTAASRRLRCTQPATVTVWPTAEGISWLRMRIAVVTSGQYSNPGGVGEGESRGATTPSPDQDGPGLLRAFAQECLHDPPHASPSQLPATLSARGVRRYSVPSARTRTRRRGEAGRTQNRFLSVWLCAGRRDLPVSVSYRPRVPAVTVIVFAVPVPGQAAHSVFRAFV